MKKLGLNEIREKYLAFFESKAHLRLPSFPLVPQNDASLLLINAGMAPLKPYFTGKETPPEKRMTTCQKCIRTPDIERVGITARHGTFFEMLGNFSFGDYFKHDATKWAWEFATEVMEMPSDRIWISVYEEDDEAIDIWVNHVGVKRERIVKLGKEDNFWEIGTGPCGPCSELHFDRGEETGCGSSECAVGCDCDRFVEFWNLVFTQFDKDENGNYNKLANPNIDTGMGLERIAAIMQGVNSLFEVDTIRKILDHAASIAAVKYGKNKKTDISLRVITDHIRSTVFLVCDGVLPSNEGRGYVLRRLLRRAARHGKLLGIKGDFLSTVADTVINESREAYGELSEKAEYIKKVIEIEEERFAQTIDQGLQILEEYVREIQKDGKTDLDGESAFKLYDTYGFPIDLTREILAERGFGIHEDAFNLLMQEQRERARNARGDMNDAGWDDDVFASVQITGKFVGYDNDSCDGQIVAMVKKGNLVDEAKIGDEIDIILNKTCFYGESGGQVGDTGIIQGDGFEIVVNDTKKQNGKTVHKCLVRSGIVKTKASVSAKIDTDRRKSIMRNHSAAHLLHKALRDVLGNHVAQAGSLVEEERVRFDFSHFSAMTSDEIMRVEREVNNQILNNLAVITTEESINDAKAKGVVALFGEKYGDIVRVVSMGDYSMELCGGCHVKNTGEIGLFKILTESGVAAGVRRIEGVTGFGVLKLIETHNASIAKMAEILKSNPSEIINRVVSIAEENKSQRREVEMLKSKLANNSTADIENSAEEVNGIKVIAARLDDGLDINALRNVGDNLKQKFDTAVIVLISAVDEKINIISMATKKAIEKGAHAGNIIREVAKMTGGGGGGKPDSAQAGGKDKSKISEALAKVKELL